MRGDEVGQMPGPRRIAGDRDAGDRVPVEDSPRPVEEVRLRDAAEVVCWRGVVMTAVLEGGVCDGLECEIDPGQTTMELRWLVHWPEDEPPVAQGTYVFDGRLDGEGRAVFVPGEG
jgi:hypothetical protein